MKHTPITRISETVVIPANAQALWKTVRNFSNIALWHRDVRDSTLEDGGPGDRVGAVRALHLKNGTLIREQLTALSDKDLTYSYSVIESPFPIAHHSSTVSFLSIEGGSKTLVAWSAEFALTQGDPDALADGIRQSVILAGFEGLAQLASKNR
jgi:hypothetical protein